MQAIPIISDGCEIIYWEITINGETFVKNNDSLFDFSGCKYWDNRDEIVKKPSIWDIEKAIDIPVQKFTQPIDRIVIYQIGCDGVARWALIEEDVNSDKFLVARVVHEWTGNSNGREAYLVFEVL